MHHHEYKDSVSLCWFAECSRRTGKSPGHIRTLYYGFLATIEHEVVMEWGGIM